MYKSYKSSLIAIPAILLAGLAINTNIILNANAESSTDFSITVNPSLSVSVSDAAVNFAITPDVDGEYNSTNFNVYTATNNPYGYTLLMTTNDTNLTSSTINPITTTSPTIPTLTETTDGISATDFEATTDSTILNHYGVAIDTNNFNAMKLSQEVKKTTTNNTSGNDTTQINLASKLDLNTVPGTYSTTINFKVTANPVPGGLEEAYQNAGKTKATIGGKEYYAMQDMTTDICNAVTLEDDVIEVYDKRDNTIYHIGKLADNRCWLLDNLALDPTDSSVQAKLAGNTNATDAAISNFINGGNANNNAGWSSVAVAETVMPPDYNWEDDLSFANEPQVYGLADKDLAELYSAYDEVLPGAENWKIGVFYNYCAASVGTYCYNESQAVDKQNTAIDAEYDICPTGWRMPTGGPLPTNGGQANGGEYQALADAYPDITGGEKQVRRFRMAFHDALAGFYYSDLENIYSKNESAYWSSTYAPISLINGHETETYLLGICDLSCYDGEEEDFIPIGCVTPQMQSLPRQVLLSVRCVAR